MVSMIACHKRQRVTQQNGGHIKFQSQSPKLEPPEASREYWAMKDVRD